MASTPERTWMSSNEAWIPQARSSIAGLEPYWPSLLAGGGVALILIVLAWSNGGYFPTAFLAAGAVSFGLLAIALVLSRFQLALSPSALMGIGALAGLTAWTGISTGWSANADTGLLDMQRSLGYTGVFALGVLAAARGRFSRHVVWGVFGCIAVVVGAGVTSRLYPGLIHTPNGYTNYRLSYPLSYWNTFGAMAAMGSVLGLGLAANKRSPIGARAAAAAGGTLCICGMYLSLSRGAWLALFVGIITLSALAPRRAPLLVSTLIVGGVGALVIVRLGSYPALVDTPTAGAGQSHAGSGFGPQLAGMIALAAIAQAGAVLLEGSASMDFVRTPLRRGAAIVGVIALAVAAIGYLAKRDQVEGKAASTLSSTSDYFRHQWNDFMRAGALQANGSARLTSTKGTRSDVYRVALDGFGAHPIAGDGAGSFEVRWMRDRRVSEAVRNAHSLYLETLDEMGLVGILFLALLIGSILAAALRSCRRPAAMSRGYAAAATAGWLVWLAHAAIDWDWQMSALTGVALVLAASLMPEGRRRRRRRRPSTEAVAPSEGEAPSEAVAPSYPAAAARTVVASAVCLALAGYLGWHYRDERRLGEAASLQAQARYQEAASLAHKITANPTATRARLLEAYAALAQRHPTVATGEFAEAVRRDGEDWRVRRDYGLTLIQSGHAAEGQAQLQRALALNPRTSLSP